MVISEANQVLESFVAIKKKLITQILYSSNCLYFVFLPLRFMFLEKFHFFSQLCDLLPCNNSQESLSILPV